MWRWLALIAVTGCGTETPAELRTSVRLSAALHNDTETVNIYALGPKRTDGIFLTCPSLQQFDIQPTDAKVELLANTSIALAGNKRSGQLTDVEAGSGRLVYVAAIGGGSLVGNGCTDDVTVPEGKSVDVTVEVFAVSED